jgi:nicotinamidase-related amidase
VLLEGFFLIFTSDSVRESNQIRLPFGDGKTSPVAVADVARVVTALFANPQPHIGNIYHLTGQKAAWLRKSFEYGTWGGEIRREFEPQPGEIVAQEHWCSSGFANTDLDLQLKKHGIHQLIVMGLIAHTCVEATVRYAAELGYEITMVKDATASYSDKEMHAALEVNIPNYASAIVTTNEVVESISSPKDLELRAQS